MRSVENRASRTRGKSRNVSRYRGSLYIYTGTNNYVDRYSSPSRTSEPTKFQYQVPGIVHTVGRYCPWNSTFRGAGKASCFSREN